MERVLGLDIGTSSVGWAVLEVPSGADPDGTEGVVLALGSRIFQAGAELKGNIATTKAAQRRVQRTMRRQIARRARRRQSLRSELAAVGLLPAADDEFGALLDNDPNVLWDRGLAGERLELFEIGRVAYWLSSKRGFLSLRSGGSQMLDEDGFVPSRYRLSQFSPETGARSVRGQEDAFLAFLAAQQQHHPGVLDDRRIVGVRGRLEYPVRPVEQEKFRGDGTLLDEFGLHGMVFFQRKVYWDQGTIGRCSLDPESGNRAARAERLSQQFQIWQTVIHLRVGNDQRPLDADERRRLFGALNAQKSMKFSKVRAVVNLAPSEEINFERPNRDALDGNQTDAVLRGALPKGVWDAFPEHDRDALVHLILGNGTEDQLRSQLKAQFHLDDAVVDKVLKVKLPTGRMAFSRRTLRRLLAEIPDADHVRDAMTAAGFRMPEDVRADRDGALDDVTNPLVRTALRQVDQLVSALGRRFARDGHPAFDVVRIELTRDVSNNAKQREQAMKRQRQHEQERKAAKDFIAEWSPGSGESSETIRRVRLWKDQNNFCLYCGKAIPATRVFSPEFEVDHIRPRAATLDNSLANVALVCAGENSAKSDRTVFEWLGADERDVIVDRARSWGLPYPKLRNLMTDHVESDTIPQALLVQTGYVNGLARDLVRTKPGLTGRVEVSRGRLTAQLRYRIGVKKDPDDHRRHALDAAMIALTDIRTAQALSRRYKAEVAAGRRNDETWGAWEPWYGFRSALNAEHDAIVVSHRVRRRVRGQLHEDTRYGRVERNDQPGKTLWARRRPVAGAAWSQKQFDEVADPVVKAAMWANLERRGKATKSGKLEFDANDLPTMPDGQQVKSVRCHMSLPGNIVLQPGVAPYTSVSSAGNHRAFVFRNDQTGKYRIVVASRLQAFGDRRSSPKGAAAGFALDGESFLFSVCQGEALTYVEANNGARRVFVVTGLDGVDGRLLVRDAVDGGVVPWSKDRWSGSRLAALGVTKALITPDGLVRSAQD